MHTIKYVGDFLTTTRRAHLLYLAEEHEKEQCGADKRPHFRFKLKFALIVGHHLIFYMRKIDKTNESVWKSEVVKLSAEGSCVSVLKKQTRH